MKFIALYSHYADEFQNFICPSMSEILSGARKYRLGLILAHQDLRQLERDRDVGSAVLANAFTRVCFRVGDSDARTLAEGFSHFSPADLQSLKIGQAICRIERADNDFNLTVPLHEEPDEWETNERRQFIIESSRRRNARPRSEVEMELLAATSDAAPPQSAARTPRDAKSAGTATPSPESPDASSGLAGTVPPEKPQPPVSSPGKGGALHTTIQKLIKAAAEARGFRAEIEHPTGSGKESIDVALIRGDQRIACEISVSTSIEHEVANAQKCLRAGFETVVLIPAEDSRASTLAAALDAALSPDERPKAKSMSADALIRWLAALPEPAASGDEGARIVQGWRVKRTHIKLTDEERAAKTKAAFELLARDMEPPR
jgi:hypothetical protein